MRKILAPLLRFWIFWKWLDRSTCKAGKTAEPAEDCSGVGPGAWDGGEGCQRQHYVNRIEQVRAINLDAVQAANFVTWIVTQPAEKDGLGACATQLELEEKLCRISR